ncbi:ribonuclease 3-like protein 2 [Vigna angularis]|uniref:ribonuclease 3-like protein 2 n=1 Tax=Phaseolus angularis TaxID=3914 RepID=UPI0022B30537|nr:ribonuclease 3-like protein 2 [Vigna angularis]
MEASVIEVERILSYGFIDRKLLEEALTHSSSTGVSYERLEFVGYHIIGLAISKHLFLAYPQLDPGQLSDLLDANVSKEKLARVAIHRGLHRFIRQSFSSVLRDEIEQFEKAVTLEKYPVGIHGGSVGAPKVLSDIVESVAAAVYFDLGFDLEKFWEVRIKVSL